MSAEGNNAARRALRLLFVLQGHVSDGLRLKQVAEAMQTTPSTALRDLQTLADEGIAERLPGNDECWRLSPRVVQIAVATQQEFARMRARTDELEQRYMRDPS